jgi:hypothetical protein
MGKFYKDSKTLKLYDSLELEMWLRDAQITGDERKVKNTNG